MSNEYRQRSQPWRGPPLIKPYRSELAASPQQPTSYSVENATSLPQPYNALRDPIPIHQRPQPYLTAKKTTQNETRTPPPPPYNALQPGLSHPTSSHNPAPHAQKAHLPRLNILTRAEQPNRYTSQNPTTAPGPNHHHLHPKPRLHHRPSRPPTFKHKPALHIKPRSLPTPSPRTSPLPLYPAR